MEFNGIPLHPLVVHAVVVLAPLAALTGVAYAAVPRWRWLLRAPWMALTLAAVVTAVVAAMAGEDLMEARSLDQLPAARDHEEWGELARNLLLGYAAVVAVGAWRLGGPSALVSGKGERPQRGGAVDWLVAGLVVLGGIAVLTVLVLAGDSGARAVWG